MGSSRTSKISFNLDEEIDQGGVEDVENRRASVVDHVQIGWVGRAWGDDRCWLSLAGPLHRRTYLRQILFALNIRLDDEFIF